ncbi:hypothetical protein BRD15_02980 [Halobacteriales archaeon SW_6_65_15]|nr:MAG: hypothetical protein BRD15_02980 [Halobacteriales archaeon SW_6_65_15]
MLASLGTGIAVNVSVGTAGAVDTRQGVTEHWKRNTESELLSPIATSKNALYFGKENSIVSLTVTGDQRWINQLNGGRIKSRPIVDGDSVFVSAFNKVYSIDRPTGEINWSVETGWGGNSSPSVTGDALYVSSGASGDESSGAVLRIERESGRKAWEYSLNGDSWSQPALRGDSVFGADRAGNIHAIDRQTGTEVWRQNIGNEITTSISTSRHGVYVVSDDGSLYVLNPRDGSQLSAWSVGHPLVGTKPITSNQKLYVSSGSKVHTFDLKNQQKLWEKEVGTAVTRPVVKGGSIYYTTMGNAIESTASESGTENWRVEFPRVQRSDMVFDSITHPPEVLGNQLYVATRGGSIYALG